MSRKSDEPTGSMLPLPLQFLAAHLGAIVGMDFFTAEVVTLLGLVRYLERMVPLGEEHLRRAISEYMAHDHGERNHQGLGNALINGTGHDSVGAGPVVRRDRIGGLLHFYHRWAGASVGGRIGVG